MKTEYFIALVPSIVALFLGLLPYINERKKKKNGKIMALDEQIDAIHELAFWTFKQQLYFRIQQFLKDGEIDSSTYKELEELIAVYTHNKGNGLVHLKWKELQEAILDGTVKIIN